MGKIACTGAANFSRSRWRFCPRLQRPDRVGKIATVPCTNSNTVPGDLAHPHMGPVVKWAQPDRFGMREFGRRWGAQPCVGAGALAGSWDWLPANAGHCITSYPVGPAVRTHIPYAHGEGSPRGWDPSTRSAVVSAQGWHGHHPSRLARQLPRARRRVEYWLFSRR